MKPTVRTSTQEDFLEYYGGLPPYRVRSVTGLVGDRIIALCGVGFPQGAAPILFMNMDEDARKYPVTMCKVAIAFMAKLRELKIPLVVATVEQDNEVFQNFAARFGFRFTGTVVDGKEIWRWDISNSDTNMTTGSTRTLHASLSPPLSQLPLPLPG